MHTRKKCKMKSLKIILIGVLASLCVSVYGQSDRIKIENVDFYMEDNQLIVTYDISNAAPEERFQIGIKFITDKNNIIIPETVNGDIGYNIQGGKYKRVAWDVLKDRDNLNENLKAIVSINSISNTKFQNLGGGPGNMFFSVLIPGWGDYLVRKDQNKRKPFVLIPMFTYTALAWGGIAAGLSSVNYDNYHNATTQEDMDNYYELANDYHRRAGKAFQTAFFVWGADVVWVFIKGVRNNSIRRKYNLAEVPKKYDLDYQFGYDPISKGIQVKYIIRF